MTVHERARVVRLVLFEGSDGICPPPVLASAALDDPGAFLLGALSAASRRLAALLP